MVKIKYTKVIFFILVTLFIFTQSKSEIKIAFIEMDKILRESLVGKSLAKQLNEADITNKKYFNEYKKKLDLEKNKIQTQKNILSKEEYEKKIISLNKDFEKFKIDGNKKINLLKLKRDKAMDKILSELNILLSEYSNKNELTFIIDQKNIVIGKTNLNITKEILKLLDLKLKKI